MSDLETRLAEALTRGADEAPIGTGLADGARTRARRRRRSRLVAAGAVLAVAVGVPAAVLTRPEPAAPPSDRAADAPPGGDGLRWESWRGVTLQVPDDWGYGDPNAWCAGGGEVTDPLVGRPGPTAMIACTPSTSYGVSFQAADGREPQWPVAPQDNLGWPPGAYVGAVTVADVIVTVVTPEPEVAQAVLDSVTPIVGADANGCVPASDQGELEAPQPDEVSVCRYDETGALEQSELLTGDDAVAARAALDATPPAMPRSCMASTEPARLVWLADAVVDLDCAQLTVGDQARQLTPDVLHWALSPGWTGDATGLPLPEELRRQ